MTRDVKVATPNETLCEAARMMADCDAGILPVSDGDRLVGMITDRDIAIRGVGEGLGPTAKVEDVMSREVKYCFEDDDVDEVLQNMGEIQVRRLPVVSREKRLVGIVSLSDLASRGETTAAGEALEEIARPGGQHTQELH
jgi:CBS domain-containing protein